MRRILVGLAVFSLVLPGLAGAMSNSYPDEPPMPMPCYSIGPDSSGCGPTASQASLNAQVIFDGEGEATVALDLELTQVDKDLKSVSLVIPGTGVRIRRALQEYTVTEEESYCVRQGPYDQQLRDYPCLKTGKRPVDKTKVERLEPTSQATADGQKVTLPLVHGIAAGQTTRLALAYKAMGYASARLGLWQFNYPTPHVPLDLDSVRVRVDVTSDLTLKGGSAAPHYQDSLAEGIATSALTSLQSGFGSRFEQTVTEPTAFLKTTQALDPDESFEVRGEYARGWIQLYWLQIGLIIGVIGLLILLVVWGERRAARITSTKS